MNENKENTIGNINLDEPFHWTFVLQWIPDEKHWVYKLKNSPAEYYSVSIKTVIKEMKEDLKLIQDLFPDP